MLALLPNRIMTLRGGNAGEPEFVHGHCVIIDNGLIHSIIPAGERPASIKTQVLGGDLVPGFIDLQVNGGGGVLLNDHPTLEGVAAIAEAHRNFGTTGLLPTLISDDLDVVAKAIAAVDEAIAAKVPGVLGIHIEGPFLNVEKKGIHQASKFRRLDEDAVRLLASLKNGRTLVTLAPELAPPSLIKALTSAGVIVAAGHTSASYEQIQAAIGEGLAGFTHLFNAMTQLGSREPGVVGAALTAPETWTGLIVDGHHVHPATLRVALAAKGPDHALLVTDAMPTVGSTTKQFVLSGQDIHADDGRCMAPDGTLAGSDLDMAMAVRNAVRFLGVDLEVALKMASHTPAKALGIAHMTGSITPGLRADLALLDDAGNVLKTWISGQSRASIR